MTKCMWKPTECQNEAIPCIKGWTDSSGKILIENCEKHEKESHRIKDDTK